MNSMRRHLFIQILLWCFCWPIIAQNSSFNIPDAPDPARFMMDYTGIFTDSVCASFERRLGELSDSTSIQIQVVVVKDLEGADPIEYGTELGRKWGVGDAEKNNGVVIVIQPKTAENNHGDLGISVGYGLEAALTDALCKRVIEKEFIPHFKNEDYAGGLKAALDVMIPIAMGESSADAYLAESSKEAEKKEEAPSTGTVFLYIFLTIAGGVGFGVAVKSILERRGVDTRSRGINKDDPTEEDPKRHYSSGSSSGRRYGGGSFGGGGAKGSW